MSSVVSTLSKLDVTGVTAKALGTNQAAPVTATTVTTTAPPLLSQTASATDQSANVQSQMDELATRRGRAANLLTSTSGASSAGTTGTKALLGQ